MAATEDALVGTGKSAADPSRVQLVSKPGPTATGIGRYAFELERGLRAAGIEIRIASLQTLMPASLTRVARRIGLDLEAFSRSYPLRADIADGYVIHLTSQTLATLLMTQRMPRPVVVTVHDILPYLLRDDPELSVYRRRMDRLMDSMAMRGLRRADQLITDSHYTKQTIIDELRIPADRIDVVHLGVDTDRFHPQHVPETFRQRYRLPNGQAYVLAVGSEDPRKDLATLLQAMALLRRDGVDATLLKVGKPAFAEQRQRNLRLCDELGIADAVRWFDGVPEEDLPLFYNAACVLAFPSRYEGFGLPVLEALACGTPVVAARASSVPELVGNAARLTEPGSPKAWAQDVGEMLATEPAIDQSARVDQARLFSWETCVSGTLCSYHAAVARRAM